MKEVIHCLSSCPSAASSGSFGEHKIPRACRFVTPCIAKESAAEMQKLIDELLFANLDMCYYDMNAVVLDGRGCIFKISVSCSLGFCTKNNNNRARGRNKNGIVCNAYYSMIVIVLDLRLSRYGRQPQGVQ